LRLGFKSSNYTYIDMAGAVETEKKYRVFGDPSLNASSVSIIYKDLAPAELRKIEQEVFTNGFMADYQGPFEVNDIGGERIRTWIRRRYNK